MRSKLPLLLLGAALLRAGPAHAAFHLMEIEQVIGGVAGDTQAQAVQLEMRSANQQFVIGSAQVVVRDAAGANPIILSTFTGGVTPTGGACRQILLATDAFAAKTVPAAVRNFSMIPIPAGYLSAGSLTFESAGGATTWARMSWGGAAYTGSGAVASGTPTNANDADGTVSPPYPGALPSNGLQALRFQTPCVAPTGPQSTTNAADNALTPGAAVFRNNALSDFTVTATVASAVPVLPGWGWCALASALALAGAVVARRLRAA
jgi:hypothetical protein